MPDRIPRLRKRRKGCLSNPSIIRFSCLGCCRVGVLFHLIERRLVRLAPLVEHFNRLREGSAVLPLDVKTMKLYWLTTVSLNWRENDTDLDGHERQFLESCTCRGND